MSTTSSRTELLDTYKRLKDAYARTLTAADRLDPLNRARVIHVVAVSSGRLSAIIGSRLTNAPKLAADIKSYAANVAIQDRYESFLSEARKYVREQAAMLFGGTTLISTVGGVVFALINGLSTLAERAQQAGRDFSDLLSEQVPRLIVGLAIPSALLALLIRFAIQYSPQVVGGVGQLVENYFNAIGELMSSQTSSDAVLAATLDEPEERMYSLLGQSRPSRASTIGLGRIAGFSLIVLNLLVVFVVFWGIIGAISG